jgi:hypothetical protein
MARKEAAEKNLYTGKFHNIIFMSLVQCDNKIFPTPFPSVRVTRPLHSTLARALFYDNELNFCRFPSIIPSLTAALIILKDGASES